MIQFRGRRYKNMEALMPVLTVKTQGRTEYVVHVTDRLARESAQRQYPNCEVIKSESGREFGERMENGELER